MTRFWGDEFHPWMILQKSLNVFLAREIVVRACSLVFTNPLPADMGGWEVHPFFKRTCVFALPTKHLAIFYEYALKGAALISVRTRVTDVCLLHQGARAYVCINGCNSRKILTRSLGLHWKAECLNPATFIWTSSPQHVLKVANFPTNGI